MIYPFTLSIEDNIKNKLEKNSFYLDDKNELLSDDFIRGNFSILEINGINHFFYTRKDFSNGESNIYLRKTSNDSKEIISDLPVRLFSSNRFNNNVGNPNVFKYKNYYYMIFTQFRRRLGRKKNNYLFPTRIRLAKSKDGINWRVNYRPVLKPKLPWEGYHINNFGLIKKENIFYLTYKSSFTNKNEIHFGVAYSEDLKRWERLTEDKFMRFKNDPSNFIEHEGNIYQIISSKGTFSVYKFNEFETYSEKIFLGYWSPLGKCNTKYLFSPFIYKFNSYESIGSNKVIISFNVEKYDSEVTKFVSFNSFSDFLNQTYIP